MKLILASKVKRIWLLVVLHSLCLCCRSIRAQQGFVSIDCGTTKNYTDLNGLRWTSDEAFEPIAIAGIVGSVTPPATGNAPTQFSTIRYFPGDQTKYCYVLNSKDHGVVQGSPYLVRASFWAGSALPYETQVQNTVNFKLLLDMDKWDDVLITLPQTSAFTFKEIYMVAMKETIDVCVAGRGIGMDIPFISSLVLRPLFVNMTSVRLMIDKVSSRPLSYMYRINYGAPSADTIISYLGDGTGDTYDRLWQPDTRTPISTTMTVNTYVDDEPPLKAMQTAFQSDESFNLTFLVPSERFYHFSLYYAELSPSVTLPGQRVFSMQAISGTNSLFYSEDNIDLFQMFDNFSYNVFTVFSVQALYVGLEGIINFAHIKKIGSIYGPIVCGLELFEVSNHDMPLGTDIDEVETLKNVTSSFSSLSTWSGDPCLPYAYNWLTCTTDTHPFISTISLSNKSLVGEVPTHLKYFKSLVQLSLANNELTGSIPDLSSLQYLKVLDLQGNNLSGPIPVYLGEMPSLTTLDLSYNNFSGEIPSTLLAKESSSKLNFSVAGNPLLCGENNNGEYCKTQSPSNNKTTNVEQGKKKKGNGALVAGVAAAGAIAALIAIAILVFCIVKQKKKTVVVRNDPSNKPAETHARDDHPESGLEYLHRGCNPSIIHRDVKSSNILLNHRFEGKISDFGISKSKQYNNTMAGGSQMLTAVQGSVGYLDPVYEKTNIANHSIDVYAFGIVLFELVTGKPPLIQQMTRGGESRHILQWAKPQIDQGNISRLVDPTLYQDFNVSSMWKVIDVAMMCVEHDRRRRPTMSEIMLELKSALSMELQNNIYDTNSSDQQMASVQTTDVRAR